MSVNAHLIDVATRHHIHVQRYANGNYKRVTKFILTAIAAAKAALDRGHITKYGTARYNAAIIKLGNELSGIYDSLSGQVGLDLQEFSDYEASFNSKLLGVVTIKADLKTPSVESIFKSAMWNAQEFSNRSKGVQHINIQGALDQFGTQKAADIISDIKTGAALGETRDQIARRLNSTRDLHLQQAKTLVTTATNSVANEARQSTLESNKDILDGWRWISTLDSHTTPVCRARDQIIFGWNDPRPPAHWGCRSTTIPVVKSQWAREIKGSTRPSVVNGKAIQVSSKTTYQSWLRKQPASFQIEVLGPSRYKLFSKGKLTLDKFIDSDGNTLTLDQLRQREPLAFEQANIH